MAWDSGLTGTARNIASTNNSPLRVMAGPGTGKSFAMKRRAARLLEAGQNPTRVLAVTFTRTAAASLVTDLEALGVPGCENIKAGTLHSYCFGLLSKNSVFEFSGRTPRPVVTFRKSGVLQFEANPMLDDLVGAGDFGPKRLCTKRILAFEAAWARLQSDTPGWPQDPIDRQFQTALLSWLRFHGAMLIGELVPEALNFLRNNPASEEHQAFDHVIVDEYQDLNKAEQELIQILKGQGSLAIVGDVDQSIYRFRHANPDGIQTYNISHPETHDEVLDECRRCPTNVVTIANHLICNNHPGSAERLRPLATNAPGEVYVVQWGTIKDEASGIAEYVLSLVNGQGVSAGDILILTPRRLLGYAVRDELMARSVPVHSFYNEEALEADSAQLAFALLSALANENDKVALRWLLGHGSPTNRRGAYSRLRRHCEQAAISPKEALDRCVAGQLVITDIGDLVSKYTEILARLDELRPLTLERIVDELFPESDDGCSILREAALLALPDLNDFGDLLECLRTVATQPAIPENADYVRVMSLHKSKGLTSKVAIVSGCVQGIVPFVDTDASGEEAAAALQEQRRLFYVAITRCTEKLVISSFTQVPRQLAWKLRAIVTRGKSANAPTVASQFLGELGPDAPVSRRGIEWANQKYGPAPDRTS